MRLIGDIPVCGEPIDEGALSQIKTARSTCEYAALMADHHKGYGVPIGGVVASQQLISPTAVGFDIACGNKAARLDIAPERVRSDIKRIMDEVVDQISFGIGRTSDWPVQDKLFDSPLWEELPALQQTTKGGRRSLREQAQDQLGTVGSGNHYVDIFIDELDRVWVGVHFGSRGLGHKVASWFLE